MQNCFSVPLFEQFHKYNMILAIEKLSFLKFELCDGEVNSIF